MSDTVDYPYKIVRAFGKGGDDLTTLTDLFPKTAAVAKDPDYQVIVSNETDFFNDFEKNYGGTLPSETVSYGSTEWGNSYASLAEVSASVKRSIEKLRTAEAAYSLVALKEPLFASDLKKEKVKAWIACGLYFEHNWTADGPNITRKQRADWQRRMADDIKRYVDTLYERSFKNLGHLIRPTYSTAKSFAGSFYVFNPLSWARTDYSDYAYDGPHDIQILDMSDLKPVPFQFIHKKEKSYIRILAFNVPSLGYKAYEIFKNKVRIPISPVNPAAELLSATDSTMENKFYKISYTSRGTITRLFDKLNNRECIRPFSNLYANDLGGGSANNCDKVFVESSGAVSATLSSFSYQPVKHTSRLTLFANSDRIEIENYIQQNTGETPVSYTFCFNLDHPDTWHEEAGVILHAKSISRGGHYADSASRLDWLALNHFADMSDRNYGVVLSNRDAYFMRIGESIFNKLDDSSSHIRVLATGRIDPSLGMENQDGDTYFEDYLALRPHGSGFSPADAMRFSLQHQNPLIAAGIADGRVAGSDMQAGKPQKVALADNLFYKGTKISLLSLSDSNVMVWALKPSEEGIRNGLIVRLWNFSSENIPVTVTSLPAITKAFSITHIETNDQPAEVLGAKLQTIIGHNRMQSFRLFLSLKSP
ncbi:glycosyl hydrolase-related protein [Flavitalea flava]